MNGAARTWSLIDEPGAHLEDMLYDRSATPAEVDPDFHGLPPAIWLLLEVKRIHREAREALAPIDRLDAVPERRAVATAKDGYGYSPAGGKFGSQKL